MKWLLTFVAGVLLGAAGLFVYLRQVAHQGPASAVAPAAVASGPAPAGAPATVALALPEAPLVALDLTSADLPLPPTRQDIALMNEVATDRAAAPAGTLLVPVEGVRRSQLLDNFDQPRGKERHHAALDIMAPKGSKVIAAGEGKVVKLFNSKPGGLTLYQFDPSGKFAYYYAHLDRYADGIQEGTVLKRGDLLGYVGTTGNASPDAPHLHFAVVELTPARQWWKGTPRNPYPMLGE